MTDTEKHVRTLNKLKGLVRRATLTGLGLSEADLDAVINFLVFENERWADTIARVVVAMKQERDEKEEQREEAEQALCVPFKKT